MRNRSMAAIAGVMMSVGCGSQTDPDFGEVALSPSNVRALMDEVKATKTGDERCKPIGEEPNSPELRKLLDEIDVTKVKSIRRMPFADDPRDLTLMFLDPHRTDRLLTVRIRIENGHCIGYNLSILWY